MTRTIDLNRSALRKEQIGWFVWIPPLGPEDYDGECQIGPAGGTFFDDFASALAFLAAYARAGNYFAPTPTQD